MVQVVTFGCRLNAFESEVIKEKLKAYDNLIVVNTCAVTGEAERQCRQAVRKLKKENPRAKIIVTGCSAQVHGKLFESMDEVDLVLGNQEKAHIEDYVSRMDGVKSLVSDIMKDKDLDDFMITGFEGRQKAFVQIQQGCNYRCTYCIVPFARGKNRSAKIEKVVAQVQRLVDEGIKKICLTGVDICSYEYGLARVCQAILENVSGLEELSFGSLDPAAIDDDLINLIGKNKKMLPHFHLSVQSGDNDVLKRMGRRHLREDVIKLCEKIRQVRKEATFGADFICGFPGETDEAFLNTCRLVDEARIDKLHVFPYSERAGTVAAKMEQTDMKIRRERAKILRQMREEKDD
ncbi:MAG: tRNA (N(6)-L-threonylcarbamoyladenosine(37)-C(2))-methylthiotransferase MtaB [Alphaproteobacteria bacterium]|nr:tRNA (N(6)-L-threonylcarbamoyladenosine(37)-C(2))-methylthiotransferase MtaB [Alphaproteobacteria bacterium]